MAKKQKNNAVGSTVGDNPLAAARNGKKQKQKQKQKQLATTATAKAEISVASSTATIESTEIAIEFDTKRKQNKNDRTNVAANTKAEQIWHRRSGAGYNLFVEYYLKQPNGIVVIVNNVDSKDGTDDNVDDVVMVEEKKKDETTIIVAAGGDGGGAGLSRAALRRKKKKRKRNPESESECESLVENQREEKSRSERAQVLEQSIRTPKAVAVAAVAPASVAVATISKDKLLYKGRLLDVLAVASSASSLSSSSTSSTASSKQKPKPKQNSNKNFHDFLLSLSKPLPLTFRFRKTNNVQKQILIDELRERLHDKTSDYIKANVKPVIFDSKHIYQAMPTGGGASSSPNNFDFEFAIDKNSLKNICPTLKEFLIRYTKNGIIARQELGSMLPVWILEKIGAFQQQQDKNKILRVLDMCSSPGSKTLQVIEEFSLVRTGGRVRANDVNTTRLDSLKDAIQRSGVLGDDYNDDGNENIIKYSNVDASKYPIPKNGYNIILCDVPCSGDGTCRKDLHIIKNWLPSIGNTLHTLQKSILIRALQCIALDGYVCYSTCSLNPIEDEAVVYGALNEINDQKQSSTKSKSKQNQKQKQNLSSMEFELIHVSKESLNGLILHPGVSTWNVADYNYGDNSNNDNGGGNDNDNDDTEEEEEERVPKLCWYDSYESATTTSATNDENNNDNDNIIMNDAVRSMWPPSSTTTATAAGDSEPESSLSSSPTTSTNTNENANKIPLNHCLRLFPQDQDTGGFFVTIIKRIK
jgi:16S rRNA C967 or C1407 C5-methylase (RsmB/RsmF family)